MFTGGELVNTEVLVAGDRIAAIGDALPREGCEVLDLRGNILSPGFIDVHTHGGDGVDINAPTTLSLQSSRAFSASQGVTGFLASILTDTVDATMVRHRLGVRVHGQPSPGAKCLGIHLEGPFLCMKYKGAMPPELLRSGDAQLFAAIRPARRGGCGT